MMNIPEIPHLEKYGAMRIVSIILLTFGTGIIVIAVAWSIASIYIGGKTYGGVYDAILAGRNISALDRIEAVSFVILNVVSFLTATMSGVMCIAGGEAIKLAIDIREDQSYTSQMLYLIVNRLYGPIQ